MSDNLKDKDVIRRIFDLCSKYDIKMEFDKDDVFLVKKDDRATHLYAYTSSAAIESDIDLEEIVRDFNDRACKGLSIDQTEETNHDS